MLTQADSIGTRLFGPVDEQKIRTGYPPQTYDIGEHAEPTRANRNRVAEAGEDHKAVAVSGGCRWTAGLEPRQVIGERWARVEARR